MPSAAASAATSGWLCSGCWLSSIMAFFLRSAELYCGASENCALFRPSDCKFVSSGCRQMPTVPDLDAFDRAIFVLLQKDNAIPQRTIGEVVNLSAPAVQRRIRRMEENSVIRANVALVVPA